MSEQRTHNGERTTDAIDSRKIHLRAWVGGIALLMFLSTLSLATIASAEPPGRNAVAELVDASGNTVGIAKFTQEEDGKVLVRAVVHDLPPGFHGFHVHAIGTCTSPAFTSAGGHFNPAGRGHPNHAGDMPVLLVNGDGTGMARFKTDRFAIADLFDADGSALIIHAKPDNYANIPTARYDPDPDVTTLATGDAGARIACGEITEDDEGEDWEVAREVPRNGILSSDDAGLPSVVVKLRNADGATVGKAKLTQMGDKVLVRIKFHDLSPGFHGFHVHAVGVCDPMTTPPFVSAGGHFNPAGQPHPGHAGDQPVLYVNADGSGQASFTTDRFSVEDLLDADGSALIVHANPDNYANIPTARYDPDPDATTLATGDAGGRIACGAIARGLGDGDVHHALREVDADHGSRLANLAGGLKCEDTCTAS